MTSLDQDDAEAVASMSAQRDIDGFEISDGRSEEECQFPTRRRWESGEIRTGVNGYGQ